MKIAVIGAGAIGGLVAGYLKDKGEDVYLVGRPDTVRAIAGHGLKISGVRGDIKVQIDAHEMLVSKPELAILATKTQDIESVFKGNLAFLKDSLIITAQNGVRADDIVGRFVPKENIISSIVMFGATYVEPGKIIHNFEGTWILGKIFGPWIDDREAGVSMVLDKAFQTVLSEDIRGMKYLKVFVNANNCIPAILGMSMQEAFFDRQMSRISIAIWREGFDIVSKLGIKLTSLPGFPLERMAGLLSMPADKAAGVFSGVMSQLSKDPVYGSVLQSIKRGRNSEIDYLNGEFVSLAEKKGLSAPLNKKLVEMVHEVEANGLFFSKEELLDSVKGLVN